MISRFLAGLTVGLLIAAVLLVGVVAPAVALLRLIWGVWPNQAAWLWIAGVFAAQTLTTALRYAWKHRNDPKSQPDAHASAPP